MLQFAFSCPTFAITIRARSFLLSPFCIQHFCFNHIPENLFSIILALSHITVFLLELSARLPVPYTICIPQAVPAFLRNSILCIILPVGRIHIVALFVLTPPPLS